LAEEAVHSVEAWKIASVGRRIGWTDEGLAEAGGLVPGEASIDDEVVVFLGVPAPFVMRKKDDHHRLVGAVLRSQHDG
jgi:hypothetical protein